MLHAAGKEKQAGERWTSTVECLTMGVKSCGNLMTFHASAPDKTDVADREKLLPSVRHRSIVHGFYSQSVAAPHDELNTRCHSNDPGAVKTVHAVIRDYTDTQMLI